ncbi:type II toxin-antitoxin system VapC family toxin [Candidatus Daviesbacteria bacterium]|nr:type II toxin-antitoxin system VapC family toxin [Candidatus Daviesbacteria bacterium]
MAKIFLDTNVFVDLAEKRKQITLADFLEHELYISPLSIHILIYLYKYQIPSKKLTNLLKKFINLVPFDKGITESSSQGPTEDFEDNVQLHSAAEAECDLFLTSDTKLLSLKFFGKARLVSTL